MLGCSKGPEKALTYQFGGERASDLPSLSQWNCNAEIEIFVSATMYGYRANYC